LACKILFCMFISLGINFDLKKETKFLIHGFDDNSLSTSLLSVKNELLKMVKYDSVLKYNKCQ